MPPRLPSSFAAALLFLALCGRAGATTVALVTDEPGAKKAREVFQLFYRTPPFSRMDLQFQVVKADSADLDCEQPTDQASLGGDLDGETRLALSESAQRLQNRPPGGGAERGLASAFSSWPESCGPQGPEIGRLATCDTDRAQAYFDSLKAQGYDFIIVVKKGENYGGSGGQIPVMTSASPASMAIHELMHGLGFADEYAYPSTCEADLYCSHETVLGPSLEYGNDAGSAFNVSLFNPGGFYLSDAEVRSRHGDRIPWLKMLSPDTRLLTRGRLGSPDPGGVGLFPADICKLRTEPLQAWVPVARDTIMRDLSTTYIPELYWPQLERALHAKIGPRPSRAETAR